ncbi:threonylcarbamoyl-AMP synthase [bacterium]|nr:MAG: threonylcarbamoyl-AMP synthase [bacterium]RKZ17817.1 MAG: threonylcarbamoyl-AMP synthase [bacterium]
MAELLEIHPETPQRRHILRVVEQLRRGAVIAYPTDTTWALGAAIGEKSALARIIRLRRLDEKHQFTLVFSDLAGSGAYARYDTPSYRLLKAHTPGPWTFILAAAREVPRRLQHPKKKTIGLRVPDSPIALALLHELAEPMLTTTLRMPGDDYALTEADEIERRAGHGIDLILDGGPCSMDLTTVVDMTGEVPQVVREGSGQSSAFD